MLAHIEELTQSAISKLIAEDAEEESIVVQVFDIKPSKNGKYVCNVSDGNYYLKALINDDVIKPVKDENSIILIKTHGSLKNSIGITNMKLVTKYPERIGSPVDWNTCKENVSEPRINKVHRLEKLEKELKTELKKIKIEEKKEQEKERAGGPSEYQSIDDLHIGLTRWKILCRVTRKTFKESTKKGLKILEVELVDKSKKKIIGTFFGESAVQFDELIEENKIYEIEKGRIREGSYNNSKNNMLSPYTLIFDSKSLFNQVSDVNIIVKNEDTAITLGEVYHRKVYNQEFDIVAYVCEVKQQVTFQKEDKARTVRELVIADPDEKIIMAAKLWQWHQPLGDDLVGKVIIFSRFSLHDYKGSVSITSGLRSSLLFTHNHPMKRYENKKIDTSEYQCTTQYKERVEDNPAELCHNTKELASKIETMSDKDTIKSVLNVFVTRLALNRKWCYDACPKCRRAGEKYTKCSNEKCGAVIEDTKLNFVMGVEVSDFFGSIWLTAYDDFAKKIFFDMGNTAAQQLQSLEKDELFNKIENYVYQPFRLRVATKKDQQGRIKHNAIQLIEFPDEKYAAENLKYIHDILG